VVRDGKIETVGANAKAPPGAKVIDATGLDVYPGWINARTSMGLSEPGARGFDDTNEMLDFNPQMRTRMAFHNDSETIPVARANGVTTVAVFPEGGMLGGQVPVMNLDGWTWEESTVEPSVGITFQFPSAGGSRFAAFSRLMPGEAGERERTYEDLKKERDARLDTLARLLDQARSYAKTLPETDTDWILEALVPIVERKLPLFTSCSGQDFESAVAFAERTGVKMVMCAGPEVAGAAGLLKEKDIPVVLGSVLTLPWSEDQSHAASYQAAAALARAGVKFAFATGSSSNVRQLPYQAAISVAWGLPREEALKALTIRAAEILGVADRLGSIEPGKSGNLVITAGDPLEVRTEVKHVIIDGYDVDLSNRHQALYERYLKRR
jgi:imidazolonepropionase-like amidohydrolase